MINIYKIFRDLAKITNQKDFQARKREEVAKIFDAIFSESLEWERTGNGLLDEPELHASLSIDLTTGSTAYLRLEGSQQSDTWIIAVLSVMMSSSNSLKVTSDEDERVGKLAEKLFGEEALGRHID